jgi:hypothetical protein
VLVLRPLPVTRVANSVPGLVLVAMAAVLLTDLDNPELSDIPVAVPILFSVVIALPGIVLAVRGYRLGVLCTDDTVIVRGYLRTYRVPRVSVIVLDGSVLIWRGPDGRTMRKLILAFTGARMSFVGDHNRECLDRLRCHLGGST